MREGTVGPVPVVTERLAGPTPHVDNPGPAETKGEPPEMAKAVTYRVKVTTRSGREYITNPLRTMTTDDAKVPDLFDGLLTHMIDDWGNTVREGKLFDIRSVRDTAGLTALNPAEVEAIEVEIVDISPADPLLVKDVQDELGYDARLAMRFPDAESGPDTPEPPTATAAEGSWVIPSDSEPEPALPVTD